MVKIHIFFLCFHCIRVRSHGLIGFWMLVTVMVVSFRNVFFNGYPCLLLQLESLPAMVAGVWSDDNSIQLEATTQFRKLLSIGNCDF